MDKNMTKKRKSDKAHGEPRKRLRAGALALLIALGVGSMAGMSLLNAHARPRRDMKWYVRDGAVQVAAPPMGEGFAEEEAASTTASRTLKGRDILSADTAQRDARTSDRAAGEESETEPGEDAEAVGPGETGEEPDGVLAEADAEDALAGEAADILEDADTAAFVKADDGGEPGQVTLKITAVGDCTFGGEIGSRGRRRFVDLVKDKGYDYFFQNVRHLFEADDLTIANLEGPLTSVTKPGKSGGFIFKGDPDYVNILTGSSVELCNLANNHTMDYGKAGLKETAKVLKANGVGYCGYSSVYQAEIKGVRVIALGFEWWGSDRDEIVRMVQKARKSCDLLIVNMHWGWEGHREQDANQTSLGHAIVNAGADLVIGTHPHVFEGIEKYKGKYIVYSLGNFCFAGNADPSDKRCLIFQQSFSFNPGMGIERANIMDAGINIIPCTVSSVQDKNDFQPTIMTAKKGGELLKAVADRSVNFSLTNTLWAGDNYMLAYGLISREADGAQAPVTADADSGQESVEPSEAGEEEAGEEAQTADAETI